MNFCFVEGAISCQCYLCSGPCHYECDTAQSQSQKYAFLLLNSCSMTVVLGERAMRLYYLPRGLICR